MSISSKQIAPGHEPIAGYVLEELIGRGGFGEVWRASAPGGMKKAIKFVFGHMGEKRTEQELKSLERIKQVQHPFILGLERFEAIDNQLVIVTELADGSLEDVTKQHRDRGSCGIPRDTLLTYMRDTADALDYLHQLYQLQHLDIKPANLLMVGGRVKVADFGLLKDLRDIECSVVGGLTPIYAPPEVFDGKPSVHSDQYSMAVMYQELLTGTRPFSGRTIAQLATQHVHNAPNLTPLPPSDLPVVARALEKSFERRFGSCSEFVDALTRPRGSTAPVVRAGGVIDSGDTKTVADSFVAGIGHANVSDLPELHAQTGPGDKSATHHSLVIALGGTGAECMDDLFSRIGSNKSSIVPTLHTVFLDTNESTARSLRRYEESKHLPTIHSLGVPLRTSNEYRDGGMSSMRSMSRRWIYNVPRSGCTEGMRPLGRLALIDHWNRIQDALKQAIVNVKQGSGSRTPRVYVVGSISGGTGSGMYLDLVHVLRSMLDDAGLEQAEILSLLAASSFEVDPAQPLALHDSLASLQEIRHFLRPENSYPGDLHVSLPTLPAARSPLKNVYLVASSDSAVSPQPYKTLAEYLWLDATIGREFLDSARRTSAVDPSSLPKASLRTVGVTLLAPLDSSSHTSLAPIATRALLTRWLGNPAAAKSNAVSFAEKLQERCGIKSVGMFQAAQNSFAPDNASRQQRILDQLKQFKRSAIADASHVTRTLRAHFAMRTPPEHAESDIQSTVETIVRELRSQLRRGRLDVITAIETLRLLRRNVQKCEVDLRQQTQIGQSNEDLAAEFRAAGRDTRRLIQLACQVGDSLLKSHSLVVAAARAKALCQQLHVIEVRLSEAVAILTQAIRKATPHSVGDSNPWDSCSSELTEQVMPHLAALHGATATPWLVNLVTGTDHIQSPASLVSTINQAALPLFSQDAPAGGDFGFQSTMAASQSVNLTQGLPSVSTSISYSNLSTTELTNCATEDEAPAQSKKPQNDTAQCVQNVRPPLLSCGGQQRLMLIAGSQSELNAYRAEIEDAHDGNLTCVVIESAAPMLIHEAQQISIDDVIARLTTLTGGKTQVSDRLLTRCDVPWSHRTTPHDV